MRTEKVQSEYILIESSTATILGAKENFIQIFLFFSPKNQIVMAKHRFGKKKKENPKYNLLTTRSVPFSSSN